MKLSDIGELTLVDAVRKRFGRRLPEGVRLGIGDDTAVLSPAKGHLLATTDVMIEGVHFDLSYITPAQLGFKLVSVNVSDIYAMGGSPRHLLLGLAMPGSLSVRFIDAFYGGIAAACELYKVSLVGGDMSSAPEGAIALSAVLLGEARRPVTRGGAKPGDRIYVTGLLGDSACGLRLLQAIGRPVDLERPKNRPLPWKVMRPVLARHLMPVARDSAPYAKTASSMIDLSDGLLIDLCRVCADSRAGAVIYGDRLPLSGSLIEVSEALGLDALDMALAGGEDYELLFTSRKAGIRGAVEIGEITRGRALMMKHGDGPARRIRPRGYRHFPPRRDAKGI